MTENREQMTEVRGQISAPRPAKKRLAKSNEKLMNVEHRTSNIEC